MNGRIHGHAFVLCALAWLGPCNAASAGGTAEAAPPTAVHPTKQVYHLGAWEKDIGYAQAVRAGNFLFVSGTVGRGNPDDPDAMAQALRMAYDRIGQTLKAHGVGFDQVVKETIYTRDMDRLKAASATRFDYYSRNDLPASTWVQIDRLFEGDYLVEIEVTALVP